MKLIELLVRELPKRGGWNENWVSVTQDSDGYLCCWSYDNPKYNELGWEHMSGRGLSGYFQFDDCDGPSCDNAESIVTRDQYQSALAASQKVEWSGECLPPVGCECEMQDAVGYFIPVDIIANHDGFAFGWNYDRHAVYFSDKLCEFRPLRSEADKKRDAMVN
ncbi:TPA: hypothetical protein J0587_004685, partial [Salmonella enterica subsp. enterica serovar Kentucky]|nr:hypothetical protein [Salmonella enterica subsp. enterica serovar Kentucky]